MKKLMMVIAAAVSMAAVAMEYVTMNVSDVPTRLQYDAKVLALDVISTAQSPSVTASTVRVVSSYTNCMAVAVVTNAIGEVSTVTNRWVGLKETRTYTNVLGSVTCSGGVGRSDVGKFIFGGEAVFATGITNLGETVKATLIIEK